MALSRFNHRGFFDDFYTPAFPSFLTPVPVFDMMSRDFDRAFSSHMPSPGFEIRESADKYHLQVEVPGIKASDVSVELENDGRVLHISGSRKRETEDEHGNRSFSESHFDKRISVGDNVDAEKMTGNLQDGVLTLVAPKKEKEEKAVLKIPISEDKENPVQMKIKN